MRRATFLRALPLAAGAVATGALTACAGTPYVSLRPTPSGGRVPRAGIPEGGVFVRVPDGRPVYLRIDSSGRPRALSSRCTHRGCQVEPRGPRLECPCHGSVFDLEGHVLQGPAERSLASVSARLDGDDVVLDFGGAAR